MDCSPPGSLSTEFSRREHQWAAIPSQQFILLNPLSCLTPCSTFHPTDKHYFVLCVCACFCFVILTCFTFKSPHISENTLYLSLSNISQGTIPSKPTHVVQMAIFHFYLWLSNISLYIYVCVYYIYIPHLL